MDIDIDIPDIYDLTNFNTKSTPDLVFTIKTEGSNIIIRCNDNIIGTYNNDTRIEHDITDIINNLLNEKNITNKELCFIKQSHQECRLIIKNVSYSIDYTKLPEFDNIILSAYSKYSYNIIINCMVINYKLIDLVKHIMTGYCDNSPDIINITKKEYDADYDEDESSINIVIYYDIYNYIREYDNDHIYIRELFIKDISFISVCKKYNIATKLFKLHDNHFRLYIKSITKLDINRTINICIFNNNNNMVRTNESIRIKENNKYINILDKNIMIDLSNYKMNGLKYSYINYNIED